MKTRMFIPALVCAALATSCAPAPSAPTPDIMIIQTSAAQTVVANFTLTAAAFTPTAEPIVDTPHSGGDRRRPHGNAHVAAWRRDRHTGSVRCVDL